jgi:hypothetical protein
LNEPQPPYGLHRWEGTLVDAMRMQRRQVLGKPRHRFFEDVIPEFGQVYGVELGRRPNAHADPVTNLRKPRWITASLVVTQNDVRLSVSLEREYDSIHFAGTEPRANASHYTFHVMGRRAT